MWLFHMEQTDWVEMMHARNGREYRLPELPYFSVDIYFSEKYSLRVLWLFLARAPLLAVP